MNAGEAVTALCDAYGDQVSRDVIKRLYLHGIQTERLTPEKAYDLMRYVLALTLHRSGETFTLHQIARMIDQSEEETARQLQAAQEQLGLKSGTSL